MATEDELRKLRHDINRKDKIIVRLGMIFLCLLIAAVAWLSIQVRDVNHQMVAIKETRIAQPLNGINGTDGLSIVGPVGQTGANGANGLQGAPGQNAQSTTTIETIKEPTIIQQNIPVPGPQGEPGLQGLPGIAGREIQLSKDSLGNLLWKYTEDRLWQPLEEVTQ